MTYLKIALIAIALTFTSSAAHATYWWKFPVYKPFEVRSALLDKAAESRIRIRELRVDFRNADSARERRWIKRKIQAERVRRHQLRVIARYVPHLPPRKLAFLVAKFDLPVSPHRRHHRPKKRHYGYWFGYV